MCWWHRRPPVETRKRGAHTAALVDVSGWGEVDGHRQLPGEQQHPEAKEFVDALKLGVQYQAPSMCFFLVPKAMFSEAAGGAGGSSGLCLAVLFL